ncbi:nucleic-acid-binding protein from transposon X-element [Trichonephila clavipes]|nr:nucleic-acid-binding protein from transposon X-element [Trichonephila clavipes]
MMMKTIRHVTRDLNSRGKLLPFKMRLKTFHDLQATFNTSNPSLMETTSAAAAEQQVKLDALVSERDSLPECLTFNCQFCNNSNPTTPVEVNAPIKNKNSHINKKAKTDKNINKTPVNDKNKTTKIDNTNVKKKFKKRKIKKDSVEDFVFPTKTARPASPSNSEQIAIANNFSDLTVDQNQVIEEKEAKIADIPNPRPLQPIHLKITKNFRNQIKSIYQKFPETTNKTSGKFIKLFSKDVEEKHNLTKFLESDKDFEFFCIKPKLDKPIKVVIKGLPIYTKTQEIHSDLEEEGFTVEKVSQLISKKHRGPLPFFLITLPRNASNSKIFDIKTLGYLQVRVEGFLVRGITQCYNCNNFFHTASECRLKPRCLKCGKEHPTKQCPIKERQENPFCINCQPSSTPLDPISETPPTIKYQVATPSQPQYKIEDGGINRFQFLVQYSSQKIHKLKRVWERPDHRDENWPAGRRRRVAGQVDRWSVPLEIVASSGHEKVPTRGKPGLERPGRPRGEG